SHPHRTLPSFPTRRSSDLHLACKGFVFDNRIQLAITQPACDVEVGRTHARPATIRDRRLRMHHGTVPLKHSHTSFEERAIPGSRSEEHTSELQSRGHLVCR